MHIILDKLPVEVRRNLARDQGGDTHWSLRDHKSLIRREIRIIETGQPHGRIQRGGTGGPDPPEKSQIYRVT